MRKKLTRRILIDLLIWKDRTRAKLRRMISSAVRGLVERRNKLRKPQKFIRSSRNPFKVVCPCQLQGYVSASTCCRCNGAGHISRTRYYAWEADPQGMRNLWKETWTPNR